MRTHEVGAEQVDDEQTAWAVIAQLIGTVLLARAMALGKTGKEFRDNVLLHKDSA